MLYSITARRFHECLNLEANVVDKKAIYFSMTDSELVHSVCRRERLTLFNFLKSHLCDHGRTHLQKLENAGIATTLTEERIKDLIHVEYQHYFKRKQALNIYSDRLLNLEGIVNDLKQKISV